MTTKIFGIEFGSVMDHETINHRINQLDAEAPDLFDWQKEFEDIVGERLISLVACTGAGKSMASMLSSVDWLQNQGRKVIICVPKIQIGEEFRDRYIQRKDGSKHFFEAKNICSLKSDSNTMELVNFLDSKEKGVLVCCTASLVLAFKNIPNFKNKFKNVKLIVDEAHHIVTGEDVEGNYNPNEIGDVFLSVLSEESNSALLVTATHFRTDEKTIIPKKYRNKFKHFEVPFYRIQEECRFFNKAISFHVAVYREDSLEILTKNWKNDEKFIFFMHRKHANYGRDNKYERVDKVVEAFGRVKSYNGNDGTITVENNGKDLVIVDLVSEFRADKGVAYLNRAKRDDSIQVDGIIAMERFKEGCDYPPLQHCIIEDVRGSYGDVIQMTGRVTRDYKDKHNCKVTMLVKMPMIDEENIGEVMNDYLKVVVCAMSHANYFMPIYMRVREKGKVKRKSKYEEYLNQVGDEVRQVEFKADVLKRFCALCNSDVKSKGDYELRLKFMERAVSEKCEALSQRAVKEIAKSFIRECSLAIKTMKGGIDVGVIDEDVLKNVDTSEIMSIFFSDSMSEKDFKKYRENLVYYMGERRTFEEHVEAWKNYNNKGKVAHSWETVFENDNLRNKGFYKKAEEVFQNE